MIHTEKKDFFKEKPLVLVSPLDWGLGHTTRMIPVIRCLMQSGCEVVVACNSTQKLLLENEFPGMGFVYLQGYGIRYGFNKTSTRGKLLLLLPYILIKIKREQMWFLRFLKQNKVAAVISDNRYGLIAPGIPVVLVTHQLNIRSGLGKLADGIVRRLLYQRLKKFTECWVPDFEFGLNFAGYLSHPDRLPAIPVRYTGCLSRFEPCGHHSNSVQILILLSGPEPQRTILENRVLSQLKAGSYKEVVLIRGLPQSEYALTAIPGVLILNHADANKLNQFICASALIISRAGYTTIMDVLKLQKKMVVIPTPGQAEQEYLAKHLSANRLALSVCQKDFSIDEALRQSAFFDYNIPQVNMDQFKEVIGNFIASQFFL